ncbi:MAG TPA: ParB N-terminal domain-containing protein, partial [Flavobacterium sp.]|nr:ParB N-terminal domain-containing protein [Flavobacterium sp.]
MIKLSSLKPNPKNPRLIKDDKFMKLVKSLETFPQMMELRPIIVDENNVIQGGNMRFKALHHLGFKEIPESYVKQGKDLTEEQWREFVIKDNVGFGEWDF